MYKELIEVVVKMKKKRRKKVGGEVGCVQRIN